MDKKTRYWLSRINAHVAAKWRRKMFIDEDTWENEREQYKEMAKSGRYDARGKAALEKLANQKSFNKKTQRIDERVARLMEEDLANEIQNAIRTGLIPKPDAKEMREWQNGLWE